MSRRVWSRVSRETSTPPTKEWLTIPVLNGSLALGTWQGVYLCEFRDNGGPRRVVFTAFGE